MKTLTQFGFIHLLKGLISCFLVLTVMLQPCSLWADAPDTKAAVSAKETESIKQTLAIAIAPLIYMGPLEGARIQKDLMDGMVRRLQTAGLSVTVLPDDAMGGTADATEVAFNEAKKKKINYLIYGSISKLGNSLSVDLRMANVTARTETATLYAQGQTSDLTPVLNELEQQIRDSLKSLDLVAEIVVQGNHRVDADAIRQAISLQNQQPFDTKKVSEDIKAIYKLGFFEDVRVDIQDGKR